MKIIQTIWLDPQGHSSQWPTKKSEILSIILSGLLLKKYNPSLHLELITDNYTHKSLADVYEMPFDSISLTLNNYDNELTKEIWALKKLFVYGSQNERFLNVDADVFKWSAFPTELLEAPTIAQNLERSFDFYGTVHEAFKSHFGNLPWLSTSLNSTDAFCVGVIGGNPQPFSDFYNELTEFFKNKHRSISSFKYKNSLSIYLEQFTLFHTLVQKKVIINTLLPDVADPNYSGLVAFNFLPAFNDFIHPLGKTKRLTWISEQIENRLRIDFPEIYYRTLKEVQIKFGDIGWRPSSIYDSKEPVFEMPFSIDFISIFKRSFFLLQKFGISEKQSSREDLLKTVERITGIKDRNLFLDCVEYESTLNRLIAECYSGKKPSWSSHVKAIDDFYFSTVGDYWNDRFAVKLDTSCSVLCVSKWRWSIVRDYDLRNEKIDFIESNIGKIPSIFFVLFYFDFEVNKIAETELTVLEGHLFQVISEDYLTIDEIFNQIKDFFSDQLTERGSELIFKAKVVERIRAWGVSGKILFAKYK